MLHANAVQVLPGAVAIPDAHPLLLELVCIGAALDEPQQLLHHTCIQLPPISWSPGTQHVSWQWLPEQQNVQIGEAVWISKWTTEGV